MSVAYQQAQKQRYRITLDLSVFGDFDPHQIDWEKLFKLEPAEKCDAYVEDLSTPDRWWFGSVLCQIRRFSFDSITPLNTPSYAIKTMRPLKYKNLGYGVMIRVPESVTAILPQLQDVMQQLEENGEDSREVIMQILSEVEDRLHSSSWKLLTLKVDL